MRLTSLLRRQELALFLLVFYIYSSPVLAKKCLYIASYHSGYEWSDGIERGLRKELKGKCELKQFNMDTKRNTDEAFKKAAGLKAKQLIISWKPDVVIVSDDNAARYVIQPYFKDHAIPIVFCGLNWTVDEYGFPYKNTTGMVEVAPITALFEKVTAIRGRPATAFYLGVDVLTEHKNLARFEQEAASFQVKLSKRLVKTTKQWIQSYKKAQNYDFVIIGNNAGINDWDKSLVIDAVKKSTRKLSVTIYDWMMPYTILGMTKVPEEQGQWAAQAALYILDGAKPSDIPIVANRKSDIWLNEDIAAKTNIHIPVSLIKKAKKIIDKAH